MNRRNLILFAGTLVLALLAAAFQHAPGYMDADYYFLGGRNLAAGEGFSEQILWNYLDNPAGLPHPSHGYWMPLTSLLAAVSLALNPEGGFNQAQWGFILAAALVPPLTASLADRLYRAEPAAQRRRAAWLAGLLAVFPGYYFGFLTTTDSFGLYMLLGGIFLLVIMAEGMPPFRQAFILGAIAGLMHLARADGFLWLFLAPAVAIQKDAKRAAGSAMGGYFLVMLGWLVRNQAVFGSPFAPGGLGALWWVRYDDLFAYPPETLSIGRWLASGFPAIVGARIGSLGSNLLSAVAVNGTIFLFPLMLAGLRRLWAQRAVRVGALGWTLAFLLMSLAFPFAGARGGFFHAAAAVQPFLWAVVPAGLSAFVEWGVQKRGWQAQQAGRVFSAGLVFVAAAATVFLGWTRVIRLGMPGPQPSEYAAAETFLVETGAAPDAIVMVNNPPGYFLANERPAIVIPDGGLPAILAAAGRYGAAYLVLGPAQGLNAIYDNPSGQDGLLYLGEMDGLQLFRIEAAP